MAQGEQSVPARFSTLSPQSPFRLRYCSQGCSGEKGDVEHSDGQSTGGLAKVSALAPTVTKYRK